MKAQTHIKHMVLMTMMKMYLYAENHTKIVKIVLRGLCVKEPQNKKVTNKTKLKGV